MIQFIVIVTVHIHSILVFVIMTLLAAVTVAHTENDYKKKQCTTAKSCCDQQVESEYFLIFIFFLRIVIGCNSGYIFGGTWVWITIIIDSITYTVVTTV